MPSDRFDFEQQIIRCWNIVDDLKELDEGIFEGWVENNSEDSFSNHVMALAHVYDVIDAVIAIAFADNTIGKVINIGNDFEISINGLAQKIISETGSKSEIVYVPYEEAYGDGFEDMERRVPNIDLINHLVGWKPKRDLTTIISDISAEMKKSS